MSLWLSIFLHLYTKFSRLVLFCTANSLGDFLAQWWGSPLLIGGYISVAKFHARVLIYDWTFFCVCVKDWLATHSVKCLVRVFELQFIGSLLVFVRCFSSSSDLDEQWQIHWLQSTEAFLVKWDVGQKPMKKKGDVSISEVFLHSWSVLNFLPFQSHQKAAWNIFFFYSRLCNIVWASGNN